MTASNALTQHVESQDPKRVGYIVAVTGAWVAARTGATAGTMTRIPESARSARIVPELIFVTYALVCVYIVFGRRGPNGVYKGNGQIVYFGFLEPRAGMK